MNNQEESKIESSEIEESKKSVVVEFNRWTPLKRIKSDAELKKLAKDCAEGLVYTDKHATMNNAEFLVVFMPLAFMNDSGKKTGGTRQDKIYNILLESEKEKYFTELGKTEEEARLEYYSSIGMIYEYMEKASPMGINGQPSFFSCVFLSKEDTVKFWEFYGQYIKLKDELEKEFNG